MTHRQNASAVKPCTGRINSQPGTVSVLIKDAHSGSKDLFLK
jgi:hypothetical protein